MILCTQGSGAQLSNNGVLNYLFLKTKIKKIGNLVWISVHCHITLDSIHSLFLFYCTFNQGRIIRPWFNTFIDDWNSDFQLLVLLQYIEIHEILPILFSFVFENKTPISEKPSPCDLDMIQIALYRLIVYDYNQRQFVLKQLRCFYYVLHRECT